MSHFSGPTAFLSFPPHFLPWALAFVAGSLLAPQLAARWPRERVIVVGLLAAAVGFCMVAAGQGLWLLVPAEPRLPVPVHPAAQAG